MGGCKTKTQHTNIQTLTKKKHTRIKVQQIENILNGTDSQWTSEIDEQLKNAQSEISDYLSQAQTISWLKQNKIK